MYSPFYEAEQKRLYPHRKMIQSKEDIFTHMKYLIENNFDTLENMRKTTLGELKLKYFINADTFDICDAFKLFE